MEDTISTLREKIFTSISIWAMVIFFSQCLPARALDIHFDQIRPVAVAGEDYLDLLGPSFLSMSGNLSISQSASSVTGAVETTYEGAGFFSMNILCVPAQSVWT